MYKTLILIVLVINGVANGSPSFSDRSHNIQHLTPRLDHPNVGIDICPECIEESVVVINTLLNLILDGPIEESCAGLCEALANRTGSEIVGTVCDVVCIAFGLDEFVKLIVKADLDPIWYCEIAELCPINDQGDAKFTNFGVTPKQGRSGTTFVFDCTFISQNGTGTGMINIVFIDPKNRTVGNDFWFEARKPGTYPEKIGIGTEDLSCNPAQGLCKWPAGTYSVTTQVCNGECGSQHPHSSVYDTVMTSFEITE